MCGISGIVSLKNNTATVAAAVAAMNEALAHRGPDGEGVVLFGSEEQVPVYTKNTSAEIIGAPLLYHPKQNIESANGLYHLALGHRRLSIIDLEPAGHQPMCNASGTLWITYNGELYNYRELREELKQLGYRFHSQSDTEVILHAYTEWGENCLSRFNGMWAFVVFDKQRNCLFGARDRFGVKPFYYYKDKHWFCFASEQKALKALPQVHSTLNTKAALDFFLYSRLEYQPQGLFNNILELFPSTCFTFHLQSQELQLRRYYELKVNTTIEAFDEKQAAVYTEQIRELLLNAVKLRMRSDVPVGSCLSGGIDSSAIVGMMKIIHQEHTPVKLFTAIFPQHQADESNWAAMVAAQQGFSWHTCSPNAEGLLQSLEDLVYSQDIPLWSTSTFAQYSVMKLAAEQGIKVVLDGQGGDELFAGYLPYFAWYWQEIARLKQWKLLKQEMRGFNSLPGSAIHFVKEKLKVQVRDNQWPWIERQLSKERKYLQPAFLEANLKEINQETVGFNKPGTLNEKLAEEFCDTRLKGYLKCEDRCGMRWGVESRTPFADDIHLIEAAFQIPGIYKMKNATTKYLLREAVRQHIPQQIYKRKDKMGYATPNNQWLYGIKDELTSIMEGEKEILNIPKLKEALNKLQVNSLHENTMLFKAITFALWRKRFKM